MIALDVQDLLLGQRLKSKLNVMNQAIATALAELAHHDAHHVYFLSLLPPYTPGLSSRVPEACEECEFIEDNVLR
jgi:hypothetical protein